MTPQLLQVLQLDCLAFLLNRIISASISNSLPQSSVCVWVCAGGEGGGGGGLCVHVCVRPKGTLCATWVLSKKAPMAGDSQRIPYRDLLKASIPIKL